MTMTAGGRRQGSDSGCDGRGGDAHGHGIGGRGKVKEEAAAGAMGGGDVSGGGRRTVKKKKRVLQHSEHLVDMLFL